MTRQEAFEEINRIQDGYVDELITLINSPDYASMKAISFTSPTGTGKTKMMSKLINRLPDYYFIVTTLSRGQLSLQVRESLNKDCTGDNFTVYGSADYKINSLLEAEDIIAKIPDKTRCIWLRDEGHIKTNRYEELLQNLCYKVINFSATNKNSDIQCKFSQTMMLRTVNQNCGTPEDAIKKLLEIKESHKEVKNYNPCAIFRCVGGDSILYREVKRLCKANHLKYIDLTDDPYVMAEICKDDNENDVIINKYKITEGIDIRRAHVLYMDNQPSNNATTIQVIGRCRRNALLYREDIDILAPKNKTLLRDTRECYVFYNVKGMRIDEDPEGELSYAFCNYISCEELKANTTVQVKKGQLANGLYIIELLGQTGKYEIKTDENTGFNIVCPLTDFYKTSICNNIHYLYNNMYKIKLENVKKLPVVNDEYCLMSYFKTENVKGTVTKECIDYFESKSRKYTKAHIYRLIANKCLDIMLSEIPSYDIKYYERIVKSFIKENRETKGYIQLCDYLSNIESYLGYTSSFGETKPLEERFSKNEITLLQYYCIRKKKNNSPVYQIQDDVRHIAWLKKEYYPGNDDRSEKITFIIIKKDISHIYVGLNGALIVKAEYPEKPLVSLNCIDNYFARLDSLLSDTDAGYCYLDSEMAIDRLIQKINTTKDNLKRKRIDIVEYSYLPLFEVLSKEESFMIRNKYIKPVLSIPRDSVDSIDFNASTITVNDMESAIIGVDLMRQVKGHYTGGVEWVESTAVSSKVGSFNKFNAFLSRRYREELEKGREQLFTGKNSFNLDKKCNSMIGYCVEYYSKYLVYGISFLAEFLYDKEKSSYEDYEIIRACIQKYKKTMIACFGIGVSKHINSMSEEQLKGEKYNAFVKLIVDLGTKTASFVNKTLYCDRPAVDIIDPNLSIMHISGLADYITEDTILDVKVRNYIDEKCIRQVLAYQYLSTKRSDLHINRVIVYDATSDKAVTIMISKDNIKG